MCYFTSTVNSLGHVETVRNITTLFLGKPPGGSEHYLALILSALTDTLLFLNQRKREFLPRKNVPDLGSAAYEANTLPTEIPRLV